MIHAPAAGQPALLPALAAMTWLQALVALALFAPGAVAPSAHLDIPSLSMFSTAVFAVGVVTSFLDGWPDQPARIAADGESLRRRGGRQYGARGVRVRSGAAVGGTLSRPRLRPRTPASTALLGKLVTDERRALVFSLRQTGNQIGAVCGSLALPAIAIWLAPQWSYAAVAACAICGIVAFEWLRPRYEGMAQAPPQLGMRARLALVSSDRRIAALAGGFDALQRNAARAQHLFCHARCTRTRAQPSRSRCRTCLRASRRLVGAARMGISCDAHRFRKIGPDRPRAGNDRYVQPRSDFGAICSANRDNMRLLLHSVLRPAAGTVYSSRRSHGLPRKTASARRPEPC